MMKLRTLVGLCAVMGAGVAGACGDPFVMATGGGGSGAGGSSTSSSDSTKTDGGVDGGNTKCTSGASATCTGESEPSYCDRDAHICRKCSNLTRLIFGAPSAIGLANTTTKREVPREDPTSQTIYAIESGTWVARTRLGVGKQWGAWEWVTDINDAVGTPNQGILVLKDGTSVAPLLSPPSTFDPKGPVFVVDHYQALGHALFAVVDSGDAGVAISLNMPSVVFSNIAVATNLAPARLWWISGTVASNGSVVEKHLETGTAGNVDNKVLTLASPTCSGNPITAQNPWVTPDGSTLFFDGYCMGNTARQIFVAQVNDAGQPVNDPASVDILNGRPNGSNWSGPSLSTDLCSILFAEQDTTGTPLTYTILRAYRE